MDVLQVDFHARNAAEIFTRSLKHTGFAVINDHPIKKTLIYEVYREWQSFFASQDKHHYLHVKQTQDGFFPSSISETAKGANQKDLKEFFQYY